MLEQNPICPRLTCYLNKESKEGRVFWIKDKEFYNQTGGSTGLVAFDLSLLPSSNIITDVEVLAATSCMSSHSTGEYLVEVYRLDRKDPFPVNTDRYRLISKIHELPNYQDLVQKASTGDTVELRNFLSENSIFYKIKRSDNHWLKDIPEDVKLVCKIKQSNDYLQK